MDRQCMARALPTNAIIPKQSPCEVRLGTVSALRQPQAATEALKHNDGAWLLHGLRRYCANNQAKATYDKPLATLTQGTLAICVADHVAPP